MAMPDYCPSCKEQVSYRIIQGRTIPIGCKCGGWNSNQHREPDECRRNYNSWPESDFCRPTRCPKCQAEVYFIRHNGGSVWVDDLGSPWPKHACFDTANTERAGKGFHEWVLHTAQQHNAVLFGLVVRRKASGSVHGSFRQLAVARSDKTGHYVEVKQMCDVAVGDLVIWLEKFGRVFLVDSVGRQHDVVRVMKIVPHDFFEPILAKSFPSTGVP